MEHLPGRNMKFRLTGALLCALLAAPAAAQDYPQRAIKVVVPSAAGGSPDIIIRLLAQVAGQDLGQTLVVENKPGSSGIAGITEVYRAQPDGYTVGYANNVTLAINRSTFKELPYDPDRLAPVALLIKVANILAVNPQSPAQSIGQFADYVKQRPDQVTYASPGQGTSGHLSGELLAQTAGLRMMHVPYRGSPAATTDVIGGTVDALIDNTASISAHIRSGKLRPLAITSLQRSPLFPDLPTIAETLQPGFESVAWGGLVAPPGTPAEIVQKLNAAFNKALQEPATRQRLQDMGIEIVGGTPQALSDYAAQETRKWAEVVKQAKLPVQ
ncbi:tripartite tricarboxylate transporter substrate binding protein [Bordetella sp. BOR01]|uniref:Bug family tripartite tricarboxylate transporter substrate binding protein n=1 Tax=Bordetella sp. BOR01 TaxID=2854779 RepID=UPI001C497C7D|nr:tripartite tricarboxylate transporter substrate binding protein [Bordetella sp. BOR01]MBV7482340.1 tripartite tricarboxylate transporter substrate binding protein [Bordetella sp. BOR01]